VFREQWQGNDCTQHQVKQHRPVGEPLTVRFLCPQILPHNTPPTIIVDFALNFESGTTSKE
jgi:hypothetical protein